jgi:hypothetical protein
MTALAPRGRFLVAALLAVAFSLGGCHSLKAQ